MGMVFTWDEVCLERVPESQAHGLVVAMLREAFVHPSIVAGVVCGSVNYGTHNVRSDIDCMILYNEANEDVVTGIESEVRLGASRLYVPLDFVELTVESATTARHAISPSMANHIVCSQARGGTIKRDPFAVVDLFLLDNRLEAMSWCRQKIRSIRNGISEHGYTEEQEAHFCKLVLEAPVHGMRKLLLSAGDCEDDSKTTVLEMAARHYPELHEELDRLCRFDLDYTRELTAHLFLPNERAYREVLWGIRAEAGSVVRLLRRVVEQLDNLNK